MKITIFGSGYVGLVTGTCLAEVGHDVLCVDIDKNKIANLKQGIIPIYEPWLEELVKRNFEAGRLDFSTDSQKGIEFGQAIFSAVGTPPDANYKADLKFVRAVAKTFGKYAKADKVFINKSTVPVGTGEMCSKIIGEEFKKRGVSFQFEVVSNPEFLKEGSAIKDFMVPDRIVIGCSSKNTKEIMNQIYKVFSRADKPILFTDVKSSEIIKYASNAFLATKISFINEIANFAEIVGAKVGDISKGMGLDNRIGPRFLQAGIGYGGSCFPKDVNALIETGKENNYEFKIIQATEEVNRLQKLKVLEKLRKFYSSFKGLKIALWGVTFKPKTDDIRESAANYVLKELLKEWVEQVRVWDPVGLTNFKEKYSNLDKVYFAKNNYNALEGVDALIILTEWDEFRLPDFTKIKNLMNKKVIIDGRNIWDQEEMKKLEFEYEGVGKG